MNTTSFEGGGSTEDGNGFRNGPSGVPSVLVIEQTEATRRLMEQALRPDYRVDAVATYEQARSHAAETRYDGIILSVYQRDVEMGIELMEDLRASPHSDDVPIIFVGRSPLDRDTSSLLDAGFDDVLRMPFAESELLDIMARQVPTE